MTDQVNNFSNRMMMKHVLMFAAAILSANMLFAQDTQSPHKVKADHIRVIRGLLQLQTGNINSTARITTGVASERVIAQSTRDSFGVINDTVNLGYTLSRGSAYDYNDMIYPYNYPYNTSPMFNYAGIFTKPQVLFDTFTHWTIDPNTDVFGYYETAYAGYDNANNMKSYLDIFADSAINPNMLYANRFNTANNIDTGYWLTWTLGAADSGFKQFFTYNSANKLVKDSIYEMHLGTWRVASRSLYTYDGSGNLIQIDNYSNNTDTSFTLPLAEQLQYINTYDGSNRLATVFSKYYDGTSLSPYVKDTFAYSGAHAYHNSWKEYQYDPINMYWAPMFYMSKITNVAGLPDTVNIQGFDSLLNAWVPQTMDIIHYNTSNDPDTLRDYEYSFTHFPSTPSYKTIYYYAPYINALGVQNIVAIKDNARVYPNPSSDIVTISQLGVAQNSSISIAVVNVKGQMVLRESIHWQSEAQISLSGLVPGIYWLEIQDATGNIIHRQAVVKQ